MSDYSCRTSKHCQRRLLAAIGGLALLLTGTRPAAAQGPTSGSNEGRLHFTGGLDVPSVYVFRGIVQESDPKLTLFPYGDLAIALASGDGGVRSVGVNVGTWHSLQTGSRGSDGPSGKIHYQENFYATFALGLSGGWGVDTTYTAYTSPNFMFNTVKEVSFKVGNSDNYTPYGVVAFELGSDDDPTGEKPGQADGGERKGIYLELGVDPNWPLGRHVSLTVPVRVGLSLKDYYELGGEDHRFGYLEFGGLVTLPLKLPAGFGAWNVHGGVDFYTFGDSTKAFNDDEGTKLVYSFGVGIRY